MTAILAASVLPLVLAGGVFYALVNQTVKSENFEKVEFARQAKISEIEQYLNFAQKQAEDLAKSSNVRYSVGEFYGFSYAIRQMAGSPRDAGALLREIFKVSPAESDDLAIETNDRLLRDALEYANVHRRFQAEFLNQLNDSPFDNVYLIDRKNQVVYAAHPDLYLGRHLEGRSKGLESTLAALSHRGGASPMFQDFATDSVTGLFAAYIAVPIILHTRRAGVIVLRIPSVGIQSLVTGNETSLTVLSASDEVIATSEPGLSEDLGSLVRLPPELGAAGSVAVLDTGLSGAQSLTAWGQLSSPDLAWMVIAEISADQAFLNSRRLSTWLLTIGAFAVVFLTALALLFSKSLTRPIQRLAEASSAVARGSLDHDLPEYARPVEYASLSNAVISMRKTLRDQVDLIGKKNEDLQQNLRQIEEKNAKLQEADREKDRFLANTSHELRTPLNGIIGILDSLDVGSMGALQPTQRSQVQLVSSSARRLSRLVDDLLDIYRIREGRMRLDLQAVNVDHALRNVVQLAVPESGKFKPGDVKFEVEPDLPAVRADPVRLEQILFNLVSNAVKYGGGEPFILSASTENDQIMITVRDHGPGIAPESLRRIFHPLEQLTPDNANAAKGTGLGLTIARNLAVLMDGAIEVESVQGEGAVFLLRLPKSSETAIAEPPASDFSSRLGTEEISANLSIRSESALHSDGAPLVLCVDDEPINLQVLQNALRPEGYNIATATSGTEAIRLVNELNPDLIVLDVMMPGQDGLDVTRALRRRYRVHQLPICLLTARSRSSDVIAGFDAGANDYVVKPFAKDELLARVRTLLQASQAIKRSQENRELQDEIERRIQIEDALRLSQRRMTQLLDTLEHGLLCVNSRGTITFANQSAAQILERTVKPNQTQLCALVPADFWSDINELEAGDDPEPLPVTINRTHYTAYVFAMLAEAGGGSAILLSPTKSGENSAFVQSLRNVVDSSLPSLIVPEEAPAPDISPDDPYREAIVDLMTKSVALWMDLTGKNKIELAEDSGIWRVSFDKTSLQTRTLNKYLLVDTLPKNPRWRDVVKTVNFVLARTENHSLDENLRLSTSNLETNLEDFRKMNVQRQSG